jgi:predicted NAD-dependent protein-ADP-ribosyltransferase YbiA (DUF1768 family)
MPLPVLRLFLVDDGGLDMLAVWAPRASTAKAICRKEHGPREHTWDGGDKLLPYDAKVHRFDMVGVPPLKKAGLETREKVLKQISENPRFKALCRETEE